MSNKLTRAFLVLATGIMLVAVLYPVLPDYLASNARKMKDVYRWSKADESYHRLLKYNPFDVRFINEYAAFLLEMSGRQKDRTGLLDEAEALYERSHELFHIDPGTLIELGKIKIEKSRYVFDPEGQDDQTTRITEKDVRKSVKKGMKYFRDAVNSDPKGMNTAYSVAYSSLFVWDRLDNDDRKMIVDRIRYTLKMWPGHAAVLYPLLWDKTNNFAILEKASPDKYKAIEYLFEFLKKKELWQFRRRVQNKLSSLKIKERPNAYYAEKEKNSFLA